MAGRERLAGISHREPGESPHREEEREACPGCAQLAPLLVAIYELSPREREVTEHLLHGLTTDEIAGKLFISRHTVRDHTKAIFGKFGVRSRPELTAKLATQHGAPPQISVDN